MRWRNMHRGSVVLPRPDAGPRAVCVAGRRDGPAEDCGGVYAYELISAATDPGNPDHADAVAEFERFYGEPAGPESLRTTPSASTRSMRRWLVSCRWTSVIL